MRTTINLILLLLISINTSAQLKPGFDKYEAKDMIALCNSFSHIQFFNSDKSITPSDYKKVYTSGVYGLDNKYQIWLKSNVAVIVFRGSTSKKSSWLENIYSVMIPARGQIILPGLDTVNYQFAKDDSARVHAGWSLGVSFIIEDLIHEIRLLNSQGIHDFIITGHSQGGALAHLTRAFLENLPSGIIPNRCHFKTYAFASPMVGNAAFAKEYKQRFVESKTSYSIVNPEDLVPQMPFTIGPNREKIYTIENFVELLDSNSSTSLWDMAVKSITKVVTKDPIGAYIKMAGNDVYEQIVDVIGPIGMPEYTRDLIYVPTEERIIIGPFIELEKQIKSKESKNDTLSKQTLEYRQRLQDLRGGKMYQHKPYNYFLFFLKEFMIDDYKAIIAEERDSWNQP